MMISYNTTFHLYFLEILRYCLQLAAQHAIHELINTKHTVDTTATIMRQLRRNRFPIIIE